jgi:mRNA interferase HigB
VCVRIIAERWLKDAAEAFPKAASYLAHWQAVVKAAHWNSLPDVRRQYPSADAVRVASGGTVVVFNVCGNDFRLITAIHYNSQRVFTLRFLTHAEYSKAKWKAEL